ncbi:MAG: tyrosine decarboxylase / aspartate 1-decarboxylase [Methanobacterium sp.]|jgi:tyrosine decarboxylase/aspartate 1-decarboxylase|uniref:tyrosine decarboxylase MfnA n=1 Tax=Methanobacterium sp. TaxID=2164 RepID=UPI0003C97182|nr:tyrosine decarboxylase MfnA [Methanobacterium sp.]MDI3549666.1 tyrosine decarboxylase / aspartate 1-decarboxylase [Methanobacterium sp.]CDG65738.1 L-tyrosine decarboxylase [Methanobacterium sp. MB1]
MEDKGIPKEQVYQMLRKYKEKDLTHSSGRILGSMCTCPHPVGIKAYTMFLESNLGDPGLFPGTKAMEDEVITMLGQLLGKEDVYGHIITGGTEANLMAMRAARNLKNVENPEIIVPKSAHFSFKKAADMLCLDLKMADLDEDYRMDISSVESLISDNTVAIVGVAGTTELGKIDPIEDLSRICQEQDIHLHVDAAFGGYIIPFLKESGYDLPEFDFRLPGVSSITIDPHKMGMAPIPTGGILFRERKHLEAMAIETPYLTEDLQSTVVGTRTGASTAATWALLKHLGREGYQEIATSCMDVTHKLAEGIEEAGFELVTEPELNIVPFRSRNMSVEELAQQLEKRGWAVSLATYPRSIRIIVMPHLKIEHINDFLKDLKTITGA